MMPSLPVETASTSGESPTIVKTTSLFEATSAGDAPAVGAGGDELVDAGLGAVPDGEGVSGVDEVLRHRPAHDAEPDETNTHGGYSFCDWSHDRSVGGDGCSGLAWRTATRSRLGNLGYGFKHHGFRHMKTPAGNPAGVFVGSVYEALST